VLNSDFYAHYLATLSIQDWGIGKVFSTTSKAIITDTMLATYSPEDIR
jgi:hypothetical protein